MSIPYQITNAQALLLFVLIALGVAALFAIAQALRPATQAEVRRELATQALIGILGSPNLPTEKSTYDIAYSAVEAADNLMNALDRWDL